MEFLLTRGVAVTAQWSSEPLRRAVDRFRRDLEMTLNAGELVPSGRIQLCLSRELSPEQYTIDLQGSDSMVIRAADDLAAVYALLYLSRTALGVNPLWFWNDQKFEKRELVTVTARHIASKPVSVGLRGWDFSGGELLARWNAGAAGLNWEMTFEALLRLGGNFVCLPKGKPAALAADMGLWRLQPAGRPLEAADFSAACPGRPALFSASAGHWQKLWAAAAEQQKQEKLIWRIGLPDAGGALLPDNSAAPLDIQGRDLGRVLRAQYDAIRAQQPAAPICFALDEHSAALVRAGVLDLPEEVIRLWPDNGYGKFLAPRPGSADPRTPQLPAAGMAGRQGVLFHAAVSDGVAGNCLTMRPAAMEQDARELCDAFELGARAMWLVCAGCVKPHVYPLDLLAALWRDVDADPDAHRKNYLNTYYRAPDNWALQPRQLDDLNTCWKSWPQVTVAFGAWPDQRAGEQLMVCGARAAATAWLAGRTAGPVPALTWAAGEKPFAEQLAWLREVCATALPGFETLQAGCEYAARPTTRLWSDTLLAQVKLYRQCLQGTVWLCDAWQCWQKSEYRTCFVQLGRAAQAFENARRVLGGCAHGRWAGFYQQEETVTDLGRTVWVLRALMALPRAAGDGPEYTTWQRDLPGGRAPAAAMLDEPLWTAMEKAGR